MATYDEHGKPLSPSSPDPASDSAPDWRPAAVLEGNRAWCHVAYALHALSAAGGVLGAATIVGAFVFGWPSIIAVILNYLKRGEARDSWLESHWRWQLRTFWFAALWGLISALLVFTVIGIPLAWLLILVIGLWVLYRVIRGWLALFDRKPLPVV